MRLFQLVRTEDVSGVSGTGVVAEGVQFPDDTVVLWWHNYNSLGIFRSIELLTKIHGHDGRTKVAWLEDSMHEVARKSVIKHSADLREVAKRLGRNPNAQGPVT